MDRKFFFLLVIPILLAGCGGAVTPPMATETASPVGTSTPRATTAPPTVTVSPTHKLLPTETPKPVRTITVSPTIIPKTTVTLKPTFTVTEVQKSPTSTPGTVVTQNCLAPKNYQDSDFIVEDRLIQLCPEGACGLYFQGHDIHETAITPTNMNLLHSRIYISPDQKWLAYEEVTLNSAGDVKSSQLRIVSANGQKRSIKRWDPHWRLAGWYDNDGIAAEAPNGAETTIFLINLSTGETEERLLPPLHNPYEGDLIITGPRPDYNQIYTRVMYLTDDLTFALWDLETAKLIWQRTFRNEDLYGTKWLSDGEKIAVASEVELNKAELFSVDINGQETQLTDFEAIYPSMNVTIGGFDWSPDGRYISLWMNVRPGEYLQDWQFAVLDIPTKQVTNYCITTSNNVPVDAIWSPSGQQLAVPLFPDGNGGENYSFMVIDIPSNNAVKEALH